MGLGTAEVVLAVAIMLLLFGPKKIPELARSLGNAVREYKKAERYEETEKYKHEKGTYKMRRKKGLAG
ncbi:MAG: twin-arginine translocase TatA/TatE family subunit [Candidatus Woesearchaeota archaeon]